MSAHFSRLAGVDTMTGHWKHHWDRSRGRRVQTMAVVQSREYPETNRMLRWQRARRVELSDWMGALGKARAARETAPERRAYAADLILGDTPWGPGYEFARRREVPREAPRDLLRRYLTLSSVKEPCTVTDIEENIDDNSLVAQELFGEGVACAGLLTEYSTLTRRGRCSHTRREGFIASRPLKGPHFHAVGEHLANPVVLLETVRRFLDEKGGSISIVRGHDGGVQVWAGLVRPAIIKTASDYSLEDAIKAAIVRVLRAMAGKQ